MSHYFDGCARLNARKKTDTSFKAKFQHGQTFFKWHLTFLLALDLPLEKVLRRSGGLFNPISNGKRSFLTPLRDKFHQGTQRIEAARGREAGRKEGRPKNDCIFAGRQRQEQKKNAVVNTIELYVMHSRKIGGTVHTTLFQQAPIMCLNATQSLYTRYIEGKQASYYLNFDFL